MMNSIKNLKIENRHLQILKNILANYPYQFYAYGSRVKGTARKYSDLDLCYLDNISRNEVSEIRENFTKSDLPFFVELNSWNKMSSVFQSLIKKDLVCL